MRSEFIGHHSGLVIGVSLLRGVGVSTMEFHTAPTGHIVVWAQSYRLYPREDLMSFTNRWVFVWVAVLFVQRWGQLLSVISPWCPLLRPKHSCFPCGL